METIEKPTGQKNYASILHLHNSKLGTGDHFIGKVQEDILTVKTRDKFDTIFAFEKYDGSNVGIAKVNDKIFAITRTGYLANTSQYEQHHLFADWVEKRKKLFKDMLKNGDRIAGEWLVQAHGMIYKIDKEPIIFFDFFNAKNEKLLQKDLVEKSNKYEFQMPRKLHEGSAISVESLLPLLNEKTKGIESLEDPEGIVFRVERKNKVDFLAKWVRADFPNGRYCVNVEKVTWNLWKQ